MSFIDVMLSRREVLLSLALVGLVLFIAFMLAITPMLRKRWKRMKAQRKARQAAKIAQLKKKKAAAKIAYQKRQAEAAAEAEADGGLLEGIEPIVAEQGAAAAVSATAPVMTMQAAPEAVPAAASTVPGSPITPATAEGAASAAATPAPFHPEEQPSEEEAEADGDLQSILDSVFVDDEANARYEVLLRDVEVMTAEELVEMATKLNADLRARRNSVNGTSEGAA